MKVKLFVVMLGLILATTLTAQNRASLLEIDKIKEYLTLNEKQYETISTMIAQIKGILEKDKKIISDLRERFKKGDEPGFFEKIKVKMARDSRVSKINDLLEDIENQLSETQKIKYKEMNKPTLKALSKQDLIE